MTIAFIYFQIISFFIYLYFITNTFYYIERNKDFLESLDFKVDAKTDEILGHLALEMEFVSVV